MPRTIRGKTRLLIFDEIQYLKDWQRHLKDLVDSYPNVKFVATGSAAAALRLQSKESGAGRFSHFMLPPLTFYEFLEFTGKDLGLISIDSEHGYRIKDINAFNDAFIDYLNFGGYPEAVMNPDVRKNAEQYIRSDIVDKVLLKDLPSLYGIQEIPELNRLFSVLAYNAGNEASLENLTQSSGISKPTITKYIQYLESAFLVIKLATVDDNCRTLTRERNFKIYLSNPSMRSALFAPVKATDNELIGKLTECAIISQMQHSIDFPKIRYARWKNKQSEGEVDVVFLGGPGQSPIWAGEVKWSDRLETDFAGQTRSLKCFVEKHKKISEIFFTTKTIHKTATLADRKMRIYPSAFFCYAVGRDITSELAAVPDTPASDGIAIADEFADG
jgi:predicted AAA+ superfamily ATPase